MARYLWQTQFSIFASVAVPLLTYARWGSTVRPFIFACGGTSDLPVRSWNKRQVHSAIFGGKCGHPRPKCRSAEPRPSARGFLHDSRNRSEGGPANISSVEVMNQERSS